MFAARQNQGRLLRGTPETEGGAATSRHAGNRGWLPRGTPETEGGCLAARQKNQGRMPCGTRPVSRSVSFVLRELLEQREDVLRDGVGLGHHRRRSLLQDLGLGQLRGRRGVVRVLDLTLGACQV